jgi:hypothetical protein
MILKSGLQVNSVALGKVTLKGIPFSYCPICNETYISGINSKRADVALLELETRAIVSLPIGGFITLNEAALILDVSKQAFQQNPRIKRGMIYSVKKGNSILFDKKSVELFHATKDGRYPLLEVANHENSSPAPKQKPFSQYTSKFTDS